MREKPEVYYLNNMPTYFKHEYMITWNLELPIHFGIGLFDCPWDLMGQMGSQKCLNAQPNVYASIQCMIMKIRIVEHGGNSHYFLEETDIRQ